MTKFIAAIAAISLLANTGLALGPHEVALIVNGSSAESLRVARKYAELRSIPDDNVIVLKTLASPAPISISASDFTKQIFKPVQKTLSDKGASDRILAWVYSTGFPTTISTKPAMSLTGLTFLRGNIPTDMEVVNRGIYESPLFADNEMPSGLPKYSRTFDRLQRIYAEDMPIPAFLLGFTGEGGSSAKEVLSYLERAASADHSSPSGTVYFAKSDDVRSTSREWQFQRATDDLRALGIPSRTVTSPAQAQGRAIGLLVGAANVDTADFGQLVPGSFADHLTSFAANFATADQTKCTAWLKAGAAASAGTVTEPFSSWPKFPHARIFVHYTSGCTLIESFYLSLRCPLQILPIGDPLCQPWAPKPKITISGVPETASAPFDCKAAVTYKDPLTPYRIEWFVDGQLLGTGEESTVNPSALTPGIHHIRAVALIQGNIRAQSFVIKRFEVLAE